MATLDSSPNHWDLAHHEVVLCILPLNMIITEISSLFDWIRNSMLFIIRVGEYHVLNFPRISEVNQKALLWSRPRSIHYNLFSVHYILVYTTQVNSAFRAIWLVPQSRDIKYYSPPGGFRVKKMSRETHFIRKWSNFLGIAIKLVLYILKQLLASVSVTSGGYLPRRSSSVNIHRYSPPAGKLFLMASWTIQTMYGSGSAIAINDRPRYSACIVVAIPHKLWSYYVSVYTTQWIVLFTLFYSLVPESRNIKCYSPCGFQRKKWHANPILSECKTTIWELLLNLCRIY